MTDPREPKQTQFDSDVCAHQMAVLLDHGIYRHLRFKRPGQSVYWFDIITAPGILVFTGDMGGYTFRRVEDMFQFFRHERINPGYWAEKVEAECRNSGVEKFSQDRFRTIVCEAVRDWMRYRRNDCTKAERRELWEEIKSGVLQADEGGEGVRMFDAANDFQHRLNAECTFRFYDFWDHNFNAFTYRFIWCCRALVWAIAKYDATKSLARTQHEVPHVVV